jgi:hypothetical protein
MTTTRELISTVDVRLVWDLQDPDEGISQMSDVGDVQPVYEFDTGVGDGQHDSAWYAEVTVSGNNNHTIDLTSLPTQVLGMDISRGFINIKSLVLENLSGDSHLIVGTSGTPNSVGFLGISSEIGNSGVFETTSELGYTIDSTHKNLKITNPSSNDIKCKVLVLGVYGI